MIVQHLVAFGMSSKQVGAKRLQRAVMRSWWIAFSVAGRILSQDNRKGCQLSNMRLNVHQAAATHLQRAYHKIYISKK